MTKINKQTKIHEYRDMGIPRLFSQLSQGRVFSPDVPEFDTKSSYFMKLMQMDPCV